MLNKGNVSPKYILYYFRYAISSDLNKFESNEKLNITIGNFKVHSKRRLEHNSVISYISEACIYSYSMTDLQVTLLLKPLT
jgi:hypothetical protein